MRKNMRTKLRKKMNSTEVRRPFEKRSEILENFSYGNQTIQDFAKKLSEKLKFLKPIK